jgi:hypothetical protein
MKDSEYPIEELIARHQRGEKVIITNAAAFPSEMFPLGSLQELRIYMGRTETKQGELAATFKVKITKKGFTVPEMKLKDMVDPATGKLKKIQLSYWIVRPDGIEQYAGYRAEVIQKEPPSLDSLLTKPDSIN